MEDFKVIYRILKALHNMMECEELNPDMLSPKRLGTSETKRDALLVMLSKNGYIDGLDANMYIGDTKPKVNIPPVPSITLKGLEYLQENSMMKKAAELFQGIIGVAGILKP